MPKLTPDSGPAAPKPKPNAELSFVEGRAVEVIDKPWGKGTITKVEELPLGGTRYWVTFPQMEGMTLDFDASDLELA